ncbi:hypothetical protein ACQY0O_003462 [Thecaphora frezii]
MVASTDDSEMLILAQEGGKPEVQRVDRAVTLCAHALLLAADEVLVVNDTSQDWRFSACPSTNEGTPCSQLGHSLRFYASAPLYLSYSLDGVEGLVQAGRLCIMAEEPRPDFGEADADLLLSIARMASEALEKEHQIRRNAKTADMQRRSANLLRAMDTVKPSSRSPVSKDSASASNASTDAGEGIFRYSTAAVEVACDELRGSLGAAAVAAIDISGLRVKGTAQGNLSPRTSAYPLTPWQVPDARVLAAPMTPPSELGGAATSLVGPSTPAGSPTTRRHPLLRARGSYVDEVQPMVNGPPIQLLHLSGDQRYRPVVKGPAQTQALCDWLGRRIRADKLESRVQVYRKPQEPASSDEDSESLEPSAPSASNPLSPLFPPEVTLPVYAVVPGYDLQQGRPLFCFVVMFSEEVLLEEPEQLFMESCVELAVGSIIRQKARDVDVIQAEFLRHVQHNLRTPLHGALGAVEYLRTLISSDTEGFTPSIDLRPDGVLATLLDSIALSGTTLNTYIDDLLSFQNLAGMTGGSRGLGKQVSTDIVKLVEAVCNEEWEMAQRLEMQSQRLDISDGGGSGASLEIIVKADEQVASHEWMTDPKALSHAVRKVVSNAIKFTKHGYVEVTLRAGQRDTNHPGPVAVEIEVQDTGIGMTREFCTEHLTKPFTKGDPLCDGIGLGMTIVSSTVQNMGGKLAVASEVNVGTRVTMTLPLLTGDRRPSGYAEASVPPLPFAVKRIAFVRMDTRGLRRLSNSICEYLMTKGDLALVDDPLDADCIFIPDRVLGALMEGEPPLRDRLHPDVRVVIVELSVLLEPPEAIELVQNRASLPFPSPHGPSALKLLERFLREEHVVRYTNLNRRYTSRSGPIELVSSGPVHSDPASIASSASEADSSTTAIGADIGKDAKHDVDAAEEVSLAATSEDGPEPTPCSPVPDAEAAATAEPDAHHGTEPGAKPLDRAATEPPAPTPPDDFRVLVVEDNPINMKLLTTLLKRLQISYAEAHDGAEAVSQFVSFKPAVVLLDISLPIQDGFEACAQMRAHDHPSHIVAITALSSDEDRHRGIETCGMNAWMTKPISLRVLRQDIIAWHRGWLDKAANAPTPMAEAAAEAIEVMAAVKAADPEPEPDAAAGSLELEEPQADAVGPTEAVPGVVEAALVEASASQDAGTDNAATAKAADAAADGPDLDPTAEAPEPAEPLDEGDPTSSAGTAVDPTETELADPVAPADAATPSAQHGDDAAESAEGTEATLSDPDTVKEPPPPQGAADEEVAGTPPPAAESEPAPIGEDAATDEPVPTDDVAAVDDTTAAPEA